MVRRKAITVASLTVLTMVLITVIVTVFVLIIDARDASPGTSTFAAVADTYVDSRSPDTNYGTASELGVDSSPAKKVFVKFSIAGLAAPVTSATLRIHTSAGSGAASSNGGTFRAMTDTTWSETAVTWSSQPAIDGATLGSPGAVSQNTWYEVDVTGYVTGNGTFSVGVTSDSDNGADYDSRETGDTAPQLVINTGAAPPASLVATTTVPQGSPAPTGTGGPAPTESGGPAAAGDPVLVGAGDIANSGNTDTATANLLDTIAGTVFTAGDNAYPDGTTANFRDFYEPTWGRHKARTRPAPGNHDYRTAGASGYFTYFGANAGDPSQGYYSYDLGTWHVVSLNSEISMAVGSAQERWLRADLAASTKPCTIAYWHRPRFTSGAEHDPNSATGPLVQALYDFKAEVVVTGHNHQYERFAPLSPSGDLDPDHGIRHFVAGTGGASLYRFGTIQPHSEARNGDTHGVLKFTLHANGYSWQFVPVAGKTYIDSGTTSCH